MTFSTEQEEFWAGDFGTQYIERNRSAELLKNNIAFFARILRCLKMAPSNVLELGANIGMNVRAIRTLCPEARIDAVEINRSASDELRKLECGTVYESSILEFHPERKYELVFTKTVLIHIAPDMLGCVYDLMASASSQYVLIAEYYNPSPVAAEYRGHSQRLFKRDFAGEFCERRREFRLVDYGFVYRRDPVFPQDDISWFLLQRDLGV